MMGYRLIRVCLYDSGCVCVCIGVGVVKVGVEVRDRHGASGGHIQ